MSYLTELALSNDEDAPMTMAIDKKVCENMQSTDGESNARAIGRPQALSRASMALHRPFKLEIMTTAEFIHSVTISRFRFHGMVPC